MRMMIRASVFAVAFLFLVWAFVAVLRADIFRVNDIAIEGLTHVSDGDIDRHVRDGMQGTVFGFLHKDSTFMLDPEGMAKDLRDVFPRIEQVSVMRRGLRGVSINIHEREPKALWCGDVVPPLFERASSSTIGRCYFMDHTAFIYAEREDGFEDLDRYYGSLEKADPVGQYLFSEDEFIKLDTLREKLKANDLEIVSLLLVDERDMELYLAQHAARIIVPRSLSAETIAERLVAALTSDAYDESRPLEYVDMRFETRVYIKYIDPATEDEEGAISTSTERAVMDAGAEEATERVESEGTSTQAVGNPDE